jgi:predicted metalloprotease with PDZ domain
MPSRSSLRSILFVVVIGFVRPASAAEPITYTVRFPDIAARVAEVEAVIPTGGRERIELMMPAWTPGYYRVENYAGKVEGLTAKSPDGAVLTVEQPKKNRWQVGTNGAATVVLSYRLKCDGRSVTTNTVADKYAVLNGAAAFPTLADGTPRPHDIRLELPTQWPKSMTGLDPAPGGRQHAYRATDYDQLVDTPIAAGEMSVRDFNVEGSKHFLVAFGEPGSWDGDRAAADIEKIVRATRRMWGFLPFDRYVFLCAFRPGGGGLEHRNSTLVTSSAGGPKGNRGWLGLVSHEYFHAFNVKRLRPVELGPFDYENEPRTPSLWVSEGLTSYYGDLMVTRAGLKTAEEQLAGTSGQIRSLQTSPGRLLQTLEQSSKEVWTNSNSGIGVNAQSVSYYGKGAVVGFLLDAKIRKTTDGAKSLDDLMKLAYKRYGGERGFTPDQFREAAQEVAGVDLKEWFRTALASTEELDYAEALDWYGLRFAPPAEGQQAATWKLEPRPDATDAQKARLKAWVGRPEGE